jgi:sugar/nucleoside kinase (ribokinase family)
MGTLDVVGIGNAIVDVLTYTDDAFLERHGLIKGSMTLIDADRAAQLYEGMTQRTECSGGSAANTITGLAALGAACGYVGKVRDDAAGELFRDDLRESGVRFDTPPARTGPATARCLVFVTPDAQRTMATFLGASTTLSEQDITDELLSRTGIVYIEGYQWDPPSARKACAEAVRRAKASGARIALTLSDPWCVDRHRGDFLGLVQQDVDVLFANEQEARSLFETEDLAWAVEALRGLDLVAAVTRSARGSIAIGGGEVVEVAAERVDDVVDTTGAGDLYAAGFLAGLAQGRDLRTCARLGGLAAGEVIRRTGARLDGNVLRAAMRELG